MFLALKNAVILSKCLSCGIWNNSTFVGKQIERIGDVLSRALVKADKKSLEAIADTDPRDLEVILGKSTPFGNHVRNAALHFPNYELEVVQVT